MCVTGINNIEDDTYLKLELLECQRQLRTLRKMPKNGIIEMVDVAIKELESREFKLKEKKVLKIHDNAITEVTIKKRGKDVKRYQTRCNGKRPRCSSYEALINKLYKIYFGLDDVSDFSFKAMFQNALDEKIRTENPKEKTIRDYESSYNAFISDEFGAQDIRTIQTSQLKEYIQTITKNMALTKKRFYKFKGLLNLTFEYALDPERAYIDVNPVPHTNRAYTKNCTPTNNKPEDKAFQPKEVEKIRKHLWNRIENCTYDVFGYAILFSSYTGIRLGEIPSLKWDDINSNSIHIHSQQNDEIRNGKRVYYYNPTTKNEKGVSQNGRLIPLTSSINTILDSLRAKQQELGIHSKWIFCNKNGDWITTKGYYDALCRVTSSLNLKLSNNHAFRMYLNSYVYVPLGLPVSERANLLGHSVETNLKHYTFARTEDYLDELLEKIDSFDNDSIKQNNYKNGTSNNTGYPTVISFNPNKKSATKRINN